MTFAGMIGHGANEDIRVSLGATPVINLTGTLTTLGGISARPEAIAAAAAISSG